MTSIRLAEVEIAGFRAFQRPFHASFRSPLGLTSDVVIIAGPNGTGKTSLLEAMLLAVGREDLIRQSLVPSVSDGHWRTEIPDTATIALTFEVSSAPGTELGPYAPCTVRLVRSSTAWRLEMVRNGERHSMQDPVRDSFVRDMSMEYFSSWRASFQLGGVRPSVTDAESPRDERYRFFRLKQRIIDERSARGFSDRETQDRRWLARLNEVWKSWHDDEDTWIDAQETGDVERPFDLFLVRDVGYGPQPICPLDMASSGELEWVTLAGSLIINDFKGLLLIDEPELHLHPQWQARLLPTLRKLAPDAQLVVATHSAFPWDQSLPYQRLLLLPENDPRGAVLSEAE